MILMMCSIAGICLFSGVFTILRKVVYFAPLRILEVIYIFICYYILSIIMYAGCAVVVGMPDHRSQHINKMPDDIVRTTIKVMQMSSIEAFNV
jgi:uncharacterized membrane protein